MFHIGMLKLTEEATDDHRRTILEGLAGLVGQVEGLLAVRGGQDLKRVDGNADVVFMLEFADEQSWRDYRTHPAHLAVIEHRIAPILESKTFVQVEQLTEAAGRP